MWLKEIAEDIFAVYARWDDDVKLVTICHIKNPRFGAYLGMMDLQGTPLDPKEWENET